MSIYNKAIAGIVLFAFFLSVKPLCAENTRTVLFDEIHGQLFLTGKTGLLDLSNLAGLFQKEGWTVKTTKAEITDEGLAGVDALVISGAFKPLAPAEIAAILKFIEKGGKLCVMLHIGMPVADLLHAVNVSVSNGVMHEEENIIQANDIEFNLLDLNKHILTKNLKQFSLYGGWALLPTKENAQIVAQTSGKAWIDLNGDNKADAQQAFAVIVEGTIGSGHFVVFSDDAMFQNVYLKDNNYTLAQNLEKWASL